MATTTVTGYQPDRYYLYDEMTHLLKKWAEQFPGLCRLESIGKTFEGRDLWLMCVTDMQTGSPEDKPALYIDGNHHAGEVTGSAVCLWTIDYLITQHEQGNHEIVDLLRRRTFYILPRVSADGAELFLTTPHLLRSSTRPYPWKEEPKGLVREDIDGDGRILQMRVPDPDGEWKVSSRDPRLMIPREPDEEGGQYYRLLPEGMLHDWDGGEIRLARSPWGLDINRNYPAHWDVESRQPGAGPYPLSEPETRSIAEFLSTHRNVAGAMSYHTTAGAILRPYCTKGDAEMPPGDLAIYQALGRRGEKLVGYPCISVYERFLVDKRKPLLGVFMDWLYEHLGIITFSTELWDAAQRAGIPPDFTRRRQWSEEEQLKLLAWNDRELAGRGFVPWRPFKHPQLGEVEIGGWDSKFFLINPPTSYLEAECRKNAMFTLAHCRALPELVLVNPRWERLGEDVYKLSITLRNRGYLPTSGSEQAKTTGFLRPLRVELELPEGAQLVYGRQSEDLEHLDGRYKATRGPYGGGLPAREKRLQWAIKGTAGAPVRVTARGDRAGVARWEGRLGQCDSQP